MTIAQLKEQLESAINDQLSQFKVLAIRYENMSQELQNTHDKMLELAIELKSVESLIRLSDNTYPDLFDELINSNKKQSKKGK